MENQIKPKLSFEPIVILKGEELVNRLNASDGLIMEVNVRQGKTAKAELRHENFHCTDLSFTANLPSFSDALRQGIPPENVIKEEVLKVFYKYSDLSPAYNIASSQEAVNKTKQSLLDLEQEYWANFFTGTVTYVDENIVIEVVVKEHPIIEKSDIPTTEKDDILGGGLRRSDIHIATASNHLYSLNVSLHERLKNIAIYIVLGSPTYEKICLTADTPAEIELVLNQFPRSRAVEFLSNCQVTVTATGEDKTTLVDGMVCSFQEALCNLVTGETSIAQDHFKIELVEKK